MLASIMAATANAQPAVARSVLDGERVMRVGIVLARYSLVIVLGLIGLSKFTSEEATGIMPLVQHSPLLGWAYGLGSTQAVSDAIGVSELLVVVLLLLRPILPRATIVGGVLATLTFLTTLSFLLSTPGAFVFHGLAVLGDVGAFLIKDLALLAASVVVLGEALTATARERA